MAAAGTTGLSTVSPWWLPATVVPAWMGGSRPGSARAAAGVPAVAVAAKMVAVYAVPSWITLGNRFVLALVGAAVLPWFAGRFRRQYRALVRVGRERAAQLERGPSATRVVRPSRPPTIVMPGRRRGILKEDRTGVPPVLP